MSRIGIRGLVDGTSCTRVDSRIVPKLEKGKRKKKRKTHCWCGIRLNEMNNTGKCYPHQPRKRLRKRGHVVHR